MAVIPIYHRIASLPATGIEAACRVTELFERQMAYLHRNGYRSMRLDEVVRSIKAVPQPNVRAHLRRGFRDLYSTVRPILSRFRLHRDRFLRGLRRSRATGRASGSCAPFSRGQSARLSRAVHLRQPYAHAPLSDAREQAEGAREIRESG